MRTAPASCNSATSSWGSGLERSSISFPERVGRHRHVQAGEVEQALGMRDGALANFVDGAAQLSRRAGELDLRPNGRCILRLLGPRSEIDHLRPLQVVEPLEPAQHLIWPDPQGRWPWDPDVAAWFRETQMVIADQKAGD